MMLCEAAKETDNKLRWDTNIDGVKFSLYIPKWRVPSLWPGKICVTITPRRMDSDDLPNLTLAQIRAEPSCALEPIVTTAQKISPHTNTLRYDPVGDPASWEIGSPYIPYSLTYDEVDRVRLIVQWNLETQGDF